MKRKRQSLVVIAFLIISSSFFILSDQKAEGVEPYFTLYFKVINEDPYPDYANLIKQH